MMDDSKTMNSEIVPFRILLVDDDVQSLDSTRRILEHQGYSVTTAKSGYEALDCMQHESPDLVVTDVRMPGMSGLDFVQKYQAKSMDTPFIVMTAFGQVEEAVWAMKMGAVDFLEKPFKRKTLVDGVQQVKTRLLSRTRSQSATHHEQPNILGSSEIMENLRTTVMQVSKTSAAVLIQGESGTGKEFVARAIHDHSDRKNELFVAVNCAAIPEHLLESELFGYEKGAFSGAHQAKMGLIESANRGTLLLDEIGDMPLSLQPKLLRVLEEQTIRRLGSNQERSIDVRIVAATHQSLMKMVREGTFRQDLFYRLDVMSLYVPTVRERASDIPELALFFVELHSQAHSQVIREITAEAMELLVAYAWPGNLRELSNVVERAVVLSSGERICVSDLPAHIHRNGSQLNSQTSDESVVIRLGMSLKEIEEVMIEKALHASQGDKGKAAKMLGVNERTIYRRMQQKSES